MSMARMIYVTALLGAWAAFLGWAASEATFLRWGAGRAWAVVGTAAVIGAAIGAGIGTASGLARGVWAGVPRRVAVGAGGGLIGGVAGGLAGQFLFDLGLPRALGWALMGMGIGVVEGLFDRSATKVRNGLIGGALGGLAGGLAFTPITSVLAGGTGMAGRATGFVLVGLAVGALIGVVQLVLREAWLTAVDGFRTGRQHILSPGETVLGRAEHATVPFLGTWGKVLEPAHARIVRRPDGRFAIADTGTKAGTFVNGQPVAGWVVLANGDTIRVGTNYLRYNDRTRTPEERSAAPPPRVERPVPARVEPPVPPRRPQPPSPPVARPPAPPPIVRPPAAPVPVVAKPAGGGCPSCGTPVAGAAGKRYCLVCDLTY